jgi:hypothetical protein
VAEQTHGMPTITEQANVNFGKPRYGIFRGNEQVTRRHERQHRPQGWTVNRSNDRHYALHDGVEGFTPPTAVLPEIPWLRFPANPGF